MAVTPTYVPLGTITLASTDSEIVFSSIPATYRDLILIVDNADSTSGTGDFIRLRFNTDTGSNYSRVRMFGNGSTTTSDTRTDAEIDLDLNSASHTHIIQIMDYAQTDKHKTCLIRSNGTVFVMGIAGRWANTEAINTVKLLSATAQFTVGSTFSLYGIH